MDSFSCSLQDTSFYIRKTSKRLPENSEYAKMRHGDVILTLQWRHGSMCGQHAADVQLFCFLSFQQAGTGITWVKTMEILIWWCARIDFSKPHPEYHWWCARIDFSKPHPEYHWWCARIDVSKPHPEYHSEPHFFFLGKLD